MANIYERMIELLHHEMVIDGLSHSRAITLSVSAVERLHGKMGGRNVYLPVRHPVMGRQERNRQIRKSFNGRNKQEIASRFGVSTRTVHRICCNK